jgi:hypothetical protein
MLAERNNVAFVLAAPSAVDAQQQISNSIRKQ